MPMRKESRIFTVFISVVFITAAIFLFGTESYAYELEEPDIVSASAAILVDCESGRVLYERSPDAVLPPASTTKVLTALLVLEAAERGEISLDDVVTAKKALLNSVPADASNIVPGITSGEKLTVRELLYCVMLGSDCQACNLLAEHVSGSVDAFVQLMNKRADELGCEGCNFVNSHGYPNSEHNATARGIYLIFSKALEYNEFSEIVSRNEYIIEPTNKQEKPRLLKNTNFLISPDESFYFYQYSQGGKTGYAKKAKYCLVSSAKQGERTLICVVLGSPAVESDGEKVIWSFLDSRALFEYGFNNFAYIPITDTTSILCSAQVSGSDVPLGLCANEVLTELLPIDAQSELEYEFELLCEKVSLPVSQGDILGKVKVFYRGELLGETELVASTQREAEPSASDDITAFAVVSTSVLVLITVFSKMINSSRRKKSKKSARHSR